MIGATGRRKIAMVRTELHWRATFVRTAAILAMDFRPAAQRLPYANKLREHLESMSPN